MSARKVRERYDSERESEGVRKSPKENPKESPKESENCEPKNCESKKPIRESDGKKLLNRTLAVHLFPDAPASAETLPPKFKSEL